VTVHSPFLIPSVHLARADCQHRLLSKAGEPHRQRPAVADAQRRARSYSPRPGSRLLLSDETRRGFHILPSFIAVSPRGECGRSQARPIPAPLPQISSATDYTSISNKGCRVSPAARRPEFAYRPRSAQAHHEAVSWRSTTAGILTAGSYEPLAARLNPSLSRSNEKRGSQWHG
jgi:hypothetical protein